MSPSMAVEAEAPPVTLDQHGDLRVGQTRLLVDMVVEAFEDGATPEQIAQDYDAASLTEIYGVIAWYLRHREAVQSYLDRRERHAQEIRRRFQARQSDMPDIRRRLLERRQQ